VTAAPAKRLRNTEFALFKEPINMKIRKEEAYLGTVPGDRRDETAQKGRFYWDLA
jgi:hypothetical protein